MPIPHRNNLVVRTQSDLRGYHNTRMTITSTDKPSRVILCTTQTQDGTYRGGSIAFECVDRAPVQLDLAESDLRALYYELQRVFEPNAIAA